MATKLLTVLSTAFPTLTADTLGRLITDAKNPSQDFWPDDTSSLFKTQIEERSFNDVHSALGEKKRTAFRSKLTQFLFGDVSHEKLSLDEIVSSESKYYFLTQPRAHFERMCKDNETRRWIENTLREFPIFLVVGLVTVKEAAVAKKLMQSRQVNGGVEVPVLDIATHGVSAMLPFGADLLNVGGEVDVGRKKGTMLTFVAPGERVVGVQYRKLKFALFSSMYSEAGKAVDTATLDKDNKWKMLGIDRAAGSEDILEVDLVEGITAEDLELDGETELMTVDDDEFVFINA
jgi:hypothetical protein